VHEQGHYDIITLSARDFYREAKALSGKSSADLQKQISALRDRMDRKVRGIDKRYDAETDHSRNKDKQSDWNKAISRQKQKGDGGLDGL
jgi:Bacterial protein of unknown function (DUF922)